MGGGEAGATDGVSLAFGPEPVGETLGEPAGAVGGAGGEPVGDEAGGVAVPVGADAGVGDGGDDTFGGEGEWNWGAAAGAEVGAEELLGVEADGDFLGEAAGEDAGGWVWPRAEVASRAKTTRKATFVIVWNWEE